MALLKCKMCGGDIELSEDKTFGTCDSCGSTMTFPKVSDEHRADAFNRGNHFRRIGEFDKALQVYEHLVQEEPSDAEAHWCCALCRFGIEYVEDPATFEYIPTCHRASFDSFTEDVDYLAAVDNADGVTKKQYIKDGAKIAEVQRGILRTSQNEKPFDVFICYKESDENGGRTIDSTLAQDIYYRLTDEGLRVFFARITLEDKVGSEYEPYIFAALNSAKAMVVVGTKPEHFNAVWVKNEWSRYLSIVKHDRKKVILPCYKNMDPYDLPEQLSVLQSYDMSKIGFIQDLIRGIKKIAEADAPKAEVRETVVANTNSNSVAPLLERVYLFLEDGKWQDANIYCEKVLDIDPKNAEAYLGKLMAELQIKNRKQLADCVEPFDGRDNYNKVLRFGDEALEKEMRGYITSINERNENERLTGIYNKAINAMNSANTEIAFKTAADTFSTISGFKDADALAEQCLEKARISHYNDAKKTMDSAEHSNIINSRTMYIAAANAFAEISGYKDSDSLAQQCSLKAEELYKEARYNEACVKMNEKYLNVRTHNANLSEALKIFSEIAGWKDADSKIAECKQKLKDIAAKEEADRLEAERKAEERRIAKEKAAKKRKKAFAIGTPIVAACIAFVIVLTTVIIPNNKYNSAVALMNDSKYKEAISAFEAMDGYKDSKEKISACQTALKDIDYNAAVSLMNSGKYEEAISALEAMDGYKDSKEKISACQTALKDIDYNAAVALMNEKKYYDAFSAFEALNGYKDSTDKASDCLFLEQKSNLAVIKKGDIIKFGAYEQDNDISNGKEEIEWIVLDVKGGKALVISKYALICKKYNSSRIDVTWEKCTLRKWLNDVFMYAAFSTKHMELITSVSVSADKNPKYSIKPGNATTDKVFLLSITEAEKYFTTDESRKCAPTAFAKAQGANTSTYDKTASGEATCWWWLRSPGNSRNSAARVNNDGSVYYYGSLVHNDNFCVRPALWINLDS